MHRTLHQRHSPPHLTPHAEALSTPPFTRQTSTSHLPLPSLNFQAANEAEERRARCDQAGGRRYGSFRIWKWGEVRSLDQDCLRMSLTPGQTPAMKTRRKDTSPILDPPPPNLSGRYGGGAGQEEGGEGPGCDRGVLGREIS